MYCSCYQFTLRSTLNGFLDKKVTFDMLWSSKKYEENLFKSIVNKSSKLKVIIVHYNRNFKNACFDSLLLYKGMKHHFSSHLLIMKWKTFVFTPYCIKQVFFILFLALQLYQKIVWFYAGIPLKGYQIVIGWPIPI